MPRNYEYYVGKTIVTNEVAMNLPSKCERMKYLDQIFHTRPESPLHHDNRCEEDHDDD